jgi:hypothetical protein
MGLIKRQPSGAAPDDDAKLFGVLDGTEIPACWTSALGFNEAIVFELAVGTLYIRTVNLNFYLEHITCEETDTLIT